MGKTRKILFLLLLIFFINSTFSQSVKFEKVYGANGYDYGYSVQQTYDKGYIVAGTTSSFGSGATDAYILKTDSMGVPKWHSMYGGVNIDQLYSVKQTADSGYVLAGYTNSFGYGGYDMYVVKTDKNGSTVWAKTFGGTEWDFAYSIDLTIDGGFIITGGTYSYGNGDEDMYLVKINSVGDTLWTKTFGGINEEEAKSVKQTADGGYIITGSTKSFGDINGDVYVVKTDGNGNALWTQRYGGIKEDAGYDVIESYTGEYIIGGRTASSGVGNFDGLILHLSSGGTIISAPTYGGSDNDGIYSIKESPGGRFAMMGYTYTFGFAQGTSDYLLYILNPFNGFHSGTYGGNKMETAYAINTTNDNGYIICGNSSSYTNLDHIYLVKTDSNGVSSVSVSIVVTGLNSIVREGNGFKLFPNPANEAMYLDISDKVIPDNDVLTVTIVDVSGRKLYQKIHQNKRGEQIEITTSAFDSGVYFITIESKTSSINQKLIVQH